jgi:hypothetical protein
MNAEHRGGHRALLIPVEGPVTEIELDGTLEQLQRAVAAPGEQTGYIEAVGIPQFIDPSGHSTAYVNEEGKYNGCQPNMRATDFMVPGSGIHMGDYIAGPMLLCGFNPADGEHADVPQRVVDRVRLIEREAA